MNFAAVSLIGLDVGWHDARTNLHEKKKNLSCQTFAQDKKPENIRILCELISASGITGSTRKNPHTSSILHCILALYWYEGDFLSLKEVTQSLNM